MAPVHTLDCRCAFYTHTQTRLQLIEYAREVIVAIRSLFQRLRLYELRRGVYPDVRRHK